MYVTYVRLTETSRPPEVLPPSHGTEAGGTPSFYSTNKPGDRGLGRAMDERIGGTPIRSADTIEMPDKHCIRKGGSKFFLQLFELI